MAFFDILWREETKPKYLLAHGDYMFVTAQVMLTRLKDDIFPNDKPFVTERGRLLDFLWEDERYYVIEMLNCTGISAPHSTSRIR